MYFVRAYGVMGFEFYKLYKKTMFHNLKYDILTFVRKYFLNSDGTFFALVSSLAL